MTKVEQVIDAVKNLPQDKLEAVASVVDRMTGELYTPEQRDKIERGLDQLDRGERISVEQSILAKYRNT